MPNAVAKLRFQKLGRSSAGADEWGEITLRENGTVRLSASDTLKGRLLRTADRIDKAALMYGAGGFMAVASAGAALVVKRRTLSGYILFVLAALLALGGSRVRTLAKSATRLFDTPLDKKDVSAAITVDGALTITLAKKPWKSTTFRLESGEFDSAQAAHFIAKLGT